MNGTAGSHMVDVGALAARQLEDYDTHQPGTLFAEGVVLNVQQAYELQNAVAKLRFQRGGKTLLQSCGSSAASD